MNARMRSKISATLALCLLLAACGGKAKEPANPTPVPATTEGSAAPTGSDAPAQTCVELKGTCTSKMATVACASWHDTSDCTGNNEGCCVQ